MFQTPVRILFALRPKVPAALLVATAVSTIVFAATPFLVKGVSDDFDIDVSKVGIISTAQLAGFMLTSWGAGRFLRPRRRVMLIAVVLGIVSNLLSGWAPTFEVLVAMRVASGVSLGLVAWIAWSEVFGDNEKVGDVAVIGPIVGTISAPIIASVIETSGSSALFYGLGVLHVIPLFFVSRMNLDSAKRPKQERHRPTKAAAAILACLGTITFGGSSVFVFAGVIGQDDVGLSALAVSLVFSANALASIPSARYRGTRKFPGFWMIVTAAMAAIVGMVTYPLAFWIALPIWGFSFWMGTPGAFSLLAEVSRYPEERAGDAQAIMAAGRVAGPLLGGAMYAISPAALGLAGGAIMATAGLVMIYVEWRIRPEVLGDLVSTNKQSP